MDTSLNPYYPGLISKMILSNFNHFDGALTGSLSLTCLSLNASSGKRRRQTKDFPGADVIVPQIKAKTARKRVGLLSTGPPVRPHTPILSPDGRVIGERTLTCSQIRSVHHRLVQTDAEDFFFLSFFSGVMKVRWRAAALHRAWRKTLPWAMWSLPSLRMEPASRWRSGRRQCRPRSARCPLFQPTTTLDKDTHTEHTRKHKI